MRALLLLPAALALCACGTSPLDWCHRTQDIVCDQVYACTTEAQRAAAGWADTYGTDVASCKPLLKERFCPADTNERVCGFQPSKFNSGEANACLDDVQRATCDEQATAYQNSPHCAKACSG